MGDVSHAESWAPTQVIEAPSTKKPEDTYLKSLHRAASESPTTSEDEKPKQEFADYTPPLGDEDDSLTRLSLQILAAGENKDISKVRGDLREQHDDNITTTAEKQSNFSLAETRPIDTSEVREILKNAEQQEKEKPKHGTETNASSTPTPQIAESKDTPAENKSLKSKIKDTISDLSWKTKLGATVLWQAGGIHPWRSNGEWVWVIEPWARVTDDPAQKNNYTKESDKHFNFYMAEKAKGKRVIDLKSYGYDRPITTVDGVGEVNPTERRRITEGMNAGVAQVIDLQNYKGLPPYIS